MLQTKEQMMPDRLPITEADLRQAMRDPRYWQAGHPERAAFNAWVAGACSVRHGSRHRLQPLFL